MLDRPYEAFDASGMANGEAASPGIPRCPDHPALPAEWRCDSCRGGFCGHCIVRKEILGTIFEVCRICGGRCAPIPPEERGIVPPTFTKLIPSAFGYPFRGRAAALLVLGGLVLIAIFMAVAMPFVWIGGLFLLGAFVAVYVTRIISTTAAGEDDFPDLPEMDDLWTGIARPFVQFFAAFLVSFWPVAAAAYAIPPEDGAGFVVSGLLYLMGALYMPMALTALAVFDDVLAMNPLLVVASIARIGVDYWLACLLVLPMTGLMLAAVFVTSLVPIVGPVAGGASVLYFLAVQARLMGLLYRVHEKRLGWLEKRPRPEPSPPS